MTDILTEELKPCAEQTKTTGGYMLGLGFFDSLHYGHRKLMQNVKALAVKYDLEPAVFTFDDDFYAALGMPELKYIFTLEERISIIRNEIGIDKIFVATPSSRFINKSGEEFLQYLEENNVKGIVAGEDFRFGQGAEYGVKELGEWAKATDKIMVIQALISVGGKKISTRDIRRLLNYGEVSLTKNLLCRRYFIDGQVAHGRGVGNGFQMPTANIYAPDNKELPEEGVYSTRVLIDGVRYKAVTNVGGCPTFDNAKKGVETHIIDFNGDLYGKTIRVEFAERLRGIHKFQSVPELKAQIDKDIRRVLQEND